MNFFFSFLEAREEELGFKKGLEVAPAFFVSFCVKTKKSGLPFVPFFLNFQMLGLFILVFTFLVSKCWSLPFHILRDPMGNNGPEKS